MNFKLLFLSLLFFYSCVNRNKEKLKESLIESIENVQDYNTVINNDLVGKLSELKFEVGYGSRKEENGSGYLKLKYVYERLCEIDRVSNDL